MKKLVVLAILLLCVCGCNRYDSMQIQYNKYMNKLDNITESSNDLPCDIEITYDKVSDDKVSYKIIIDNPNEIMRNINIVVSHNMETIDGYPSIGVFDEESINLEKGIVLGGYFEYSGSLDELHVEFKVLINYVNDAIEDKTIYFTKSI